MILTSYTVRPSSVDISASTAFPGRACTAVLMASSKVILADADSSFLDSNKAQAGTVHRVAANVIAAMNARIEKPPCKMGLKGTSDRLDHFLALPHLAALAAG